MRRSAITAAFAKFQGNRVASVIILLNLSPKTLCRADRTLSPTPMIVIRDPEPSVVLTVSRTSLDTAEFTPPQSPLSVRVQQDITKNVLRHDAILWKKNPTLNATEGNYRRVLTRSQCKDCQISLLLGSGDSSDSALQNTRTQVQL